MRKFYIHFGKAKTSILEVDIEKILGIGVGLFPGEYRAKVLAPAILLEKTPSGEVQYPIYFSHAFHDSVEDAKKELEKNIRLGFERDLKKHGKTYSESDVIEKLAAVDVTML